VREALPGAFPLCVALEAGAVVAVCHSSRSTRTAAAAGVETAEAHRSRGLGTAVVAGWARAVRAEGREPFYGTSWANLASRGIARRLGLIQFGEDVHPA
jgi:predicted GNAT family acetyltransferase